MVQPYMPAEQRHAVPKCQACGWVGPWQVEPLLLAHHIIICLLLLFAFGGGLIYLMIVLIIRSNEGNRAKTCPNCGAKNMHTFMYVDGQGQVPAQGMYPPAVYPPAQYQQQQHHGAQNPVAGTMMAPQGSVGGAGTRTAAVMVNGATVAAIALTPGTRYTLGRAPGNSIVLGDAMVSASHATLEIGSDGSLRIVDAGSTNGTFINGQRLAGSMSFGPADSVALGSDATRLSVAWN